MERIAAGPIDQPDVGIGAAAAVVIVGLAGMQQAIGDARRRNGAVERIGAAASIAGRAERQRRLGDAGRRAIAEAEAAARQPDLAEHAASSTTRPIGLLAVIGALQRPRRRDHGARRRHAARQRADGLGRNAGDRRRPVGILGLRRRSRP